MKPHRIVPVLVAVSTLVFAGREAYADAAPKWTDAELAGFSDVVLRGRVMAVRVGRDARVGTPYTYVSLDVAEVLKGTVPDRRIVLKQLGGRMGSTALWIAGQPLFTLGEDVVVFLELRPRDRTLTTTAQWQGKFTIGSVGHGLAFAQRQNAGLAGQGVFGTDVRPLSAWLDELRHPHVLRQAACGERLWNERAVERSGSRRSLTDVRDVIRSDNARHGGSHATTSNRDSRVTGGTGPRRPVIGAVARSEEVFENGPLC
jgi:hypothetical protein